MEFCKPEEDPFLLLESSLKAIERILLLRRGLPLRRTWIENPYGEEEITLLEEQGGAGSGSPQGLAPSPPFFIVWRAGVPAGFSAKLRRGLPPPL